MEIIWKNSRFLEEKVQLLKKVLDKTKQEPNDLLQFALESFNFDVFCFLIKEFNVQRFKFNDLTSIRFIQQIKEPLFSTKCKDFSQWFFVNF